MSAKVHQYNVDLLWTGNRGEGTVRYSAYERSYTLHVAGKPDIMGSSDPAFRGDPRWHNPEELFVAALSSCHMLWFLHLCSEAGVSVVDYIDKAQGSMEEKADGSGRFTEVVLHPTVTVAQHAMLAKIDALHEAASKMCFLANSCNFPVRHVGHASSIE